VLRRSDLALEFGVLSFSCASAGYSKGVTAPVLSSEKGKELLSFRANMPDSIHVSNLVVKTIVVSELILLILRTIMGKKSSRA
jgi:hypothetical protein